MLNPKILTVLKVIETVDLDAILKSPQVQSVIKEVSDFLNDAPVAKEKPQETPKQETAEQQVDFTKVLAEYSQHAYKQFRHKSSGEVYTLIEITNILSSDHIKFPPMAVYHDSRLKTKWSRPLKEFVTNFELI